MQWSRVLQDAKIRTGLANHLLQGEVLAERLGLVEPHTTPAPLVPEKPGRLSPDQLAAAHAVASAVRHLSEREAGFRKVDLVKATLDLGAPIGATTFDVRQAETAAPHGHQIRQANLTFAS